MSPGSVLAESRYVAEVVTVVSSSGTTSSNGDRGCDWARANADETAAQMMSVIPMRVEFMMLFHKNDLL